MAPAAVRSSGNVHPCTGKIMTLFMEPQIAKRQDWFMVTNGMDTALLSEEFENNWGESYELEEKFEDKYAVRWSAYGYIDSTSWTLCDTLQECVRELFGQVDWIKRNNEWNEEAQTVMDVASDLLDEGGRFGVKKHLIEKGYEAMN
jgi:hypothetical protein